MDRHDVFWLVCWICAAFTIVFGVKHVVDVLVLQ